MSNKQKSKTEPVSRARLRVILQGVAVFLVLILAGVGWYFLQRHVDRRVTFSTVPPRVVLLSRPPWMSDALAGHIISLAQPQGAHSAFDHQMLVDIHAALRASEWVKDVRAVRRAFNEKPGDTIEIDCTFRAPMALVKWGDYFWEVDAEGYLLPEHFLSADVPRVMLSTTGSVNLRIIEGVKRSPPMSGALWLGEDLAAGLGMVRLLYGQPFAEEILKVNVNNFAGRVNAREAQVVLVTRHATEVRWGRPAGAKDFFVEIPPAKKLDNLRKIVQQFGRVDAGQEWIDIRFDTITYPSPQQAALDSSK